VKTLVAYYSLSGTNRRAAEIVAGALGADLEEIKASPMVPLLILKAWLGMGTKIGEPKRDPSEYGLVVVGGPVFAGKLAAPVKSYLDRERASLPGKVAFFLVCGGRGDREALAGMEKAAGRKPVATAVITVGDKKRLSVENEAQAKAFAETLKTLGVS